MTDTLFNALKSSCITGPSRVRAFQDAHKERHILGSTTQEEIDCSIATIILLIENINRDGDYRWHVGVGIASELIFDPKRHAGNPVEAHNRRQRNIFLGTKKLYDVSSEIWNGCEENE